jgi:proline iminopeptidase
VVPKRLDYYSSEELPNFDLRSKLHNITNPILIYCGRHDSQCPVNFSEEIDSLIPHSKIQIFEYSNHSPFIEELDTFKEKVFEFLGTIN